MNLSLYDAALAMRLNRFFSARRFLPPRLPAPHGSLILGPSTSLRRRHVLILAKRLDSKPLAKFFHLRLHEPDRTPRNFARRLDEKHRRYASLAAYPVDSSSSRVGIVMPYSRWNSAVPSASSWEMATMRGASLPAPLCSLSRNGKANWQVEQEILKNARTTGPCEHRLSSVALPSPKRFRSNEGAWSPVFASGRRVLDPMSYFIASA
jgi:hypothetical protein